MSDLHRYSDRSMIRVLEFQPLATDEDWECATAFRNGCNPSQPLTCEELREASQNRSKFGFSELGLFRDGDQPVGHGGAIKAFWTGEDSYYVFACPHREPDANGRYAAMVPMMEALAIAQGARRLLMHGRSDLPWTVDVPPSLGYQVTQSNRALVLRLDQLAPPLVERDGNELEILSYPELSQRRLDTWERDVWRLEMDLMADVPLPEPFQDIPFERFLTQLHSKHTHLPARFVALVEGQLAGLTQLMPNNADRRIAATGLTGVLRPYRRLGIARALKVHALAWAKVNGFERIYTDTEANNPMGLLNLDLGFTFDHEMVLMARETFSP